MGDLLFEILAKFDKKFPCEILSGGGHFIADRLLVEVGVEQIR